MTSNKQPPESFQVSSSIRCSTEHGVNRGPRQHRLWEEYGELIDFLNAALPVSRYQFGVARVGDRFSTRKRLLSEDAGQVHLVHGAESLPQMCERTNFEKESFSITNGYVRNSQQL